MEMVDRDEQQAKAALALLRRTFGEALLAVYLHGSAVSGALGPQSDIDLLAVVEGGLSRDRRDLLVRELLALSARHPAVPGGPRCLEVMVFSRADLADGTYPARAAFVYGEWLREAFEAGDSAAPGRDPEFSLLLAQAAREAVPLIGPERGALLPEVGPQTIGRALRDALPGLVEGLEGDERNVLLTLARMWYTARTGSFAAKDAAAAWAMARLSDGDAALIEQARRAYLGEVAEDWGRQGDAVRRLADRLREKVLAAL